MKLLAAEMQTVAYPLRTYELRRRALTIICTFFAIFINFSFHIQIIPTIQIKRCAMVKSMECNITKKIIITQCSWLVFSSYKAKFIWSLTFVISGV